jgi:hypothetical protein
MASPRSSPSRKRVSSAFSVILSMACSQVNFELQGAQRNLKLVTADNEELEARLEETYQASIEQKKMIER